MQVYVTGIKRRAHSSNQYPTDNSSFVTETLHKHRYCIETKSMQTNMMFSKTQLLAWSNLTDSSFCLTQVKANVTYSPKEEKAKIPC